MRFSFSHCRSHPCSYEWKAVAYMRVVLRLFQCRLLWGLKEYDHLYSIIYIVKPQYRGLGSVILVINNCIQYVMLGAVDTCETFLTFIKCVMMVDTNGNKFISANIVNLKTY